MLPPVAILEPSDKRRHVELVALDGQKATVRLAAGEPCVRLALAKAPPTVLRLHPAELPALRTLARRLERQLELFAR